MHPRKKLSSIRFKEQRLSICKHQNMPSYFQQSGFLICLFLNKYCPEYILYTFLSSIFLYSVYGNYIMNDIKCKICNNSAYCLSIFDIWLSTFANRVHLILFHNARSPCVSISSFKGILWHTCADHAFSLPCATFFTSFYGMFQVKQTNSNKQSAVLHKSQILVKVSL